MKLFRGIKSCLGSIVSGLILVAVGYAGWRWGDVVFPRLESWVESRGVEVGRSDPEPVPGSPELGAEASLRIQALRDGTGDDAASFDAAELTSLLRYTHADAVPAAIHGPRVRIEDGRLTLLGDVVIDEVPAFPDLGGVLSVLPDTLGLEARGLLIPLAGPGAAFVIERMSASGIPLPRRVVPSILGAMGREEVEGLPADAIQVPLPSGVTSASVEGDVLTLRSGG